jgi:hypothetical protein
MPTGERCKVHIAVVKLNKMNNRRGGWGVERSYMYRHFLIAEKFDNIGPQAEMHSRLCRLYWLTQIRTEISKVQQSCTCERCEAILGVGVQLH